MLDAYQAPGASGETPGNYLVDRRYLSLDDLTNVAADPSVVELVDVLLHRGSLRRGLSLRCDVCNHFGWYDAEDIGQRFSCGRCRSMSLIDSRAVRGGSAEPVWYYALAEVVYQASRANFNVPVLAVHQVAGAARSVLAMTDREVRFPDGEQVEIDLWTIIDGKIVLGEAKTASSLGSTAPQRAKKAQRLRRAADLLTVDKVVFATAAAAWDPSSITSVESAFGGSRCLIEFHTSVDPYLVVDA